jgi:hypothetical protein
MAPSNAGIVSSNPTQGMNVLCVRLFSVYAILCAGSGLATDWCPVRGVLPSVYKKDYEIEEKARAQQKPV